VLCYLSPQSCGGSAGIRRKGYTHINLQAGRGLNEDVAILAAVREAIGPKTTSTLTSVVPSSYQGRPDIAIHYIRELENSGLIPLNNRLGSKGMSRISGVGPGYRGRGFLDPHATHRRNGRGGRIKSR
jgi:hypothetical protein